jgi:hypothetical protein
MILELLQPPGRRHMMLHTKLPVHSRTRSLSLYSLEGSPLPMSTCPCSVFSHHRSPQKKIDFFQDFFQDLLTYVRFTHQYQKKNCKNWKKKREWPPLQIIRPLVSSTSNKSSGHRHITVSPKVVTGVVWSTGFLHKKTVMSKKESYCFTEPERLDQVTTQNNENKK